MAIHETAMPLSASITSRDGALGGYGFSGLKDNWLINGVVASAGVRKRWPIKALMATVIPGADAGSLAILDASAALQLALVTFTNAGNVYIATTYVVNGTVVGVLDYAVLGGASQFVVSSGVLAPSGTGYLVAFDSTAGVSKYYTFAVGVLTQVTNWPIPAHQTTYPPLALFDNYVVWANGGLLYNSNFEDYALSASPATNYLTLLPSSQYVAPKLATNGQYLMVATGAALQVFYDAGNPTDSVLAEYEQARLPFGALTIRASPWGAVMVSAVAAPGVYVFGVDSPTPQAIHTDAVSRILAESVILGGVDALLFQAMGRTFVGVTIYTSLGVQMLVYDMDSKVWSMWTLPGLISPTVVGLAYTGGTQSTALVMFYHALMSVGNVVYSFTNAAPSLVQDTIPTGSAPYALLMQTDNVGDDSGTVKFWRGLTVVGTVAQASKLLTVQFSDDDYSTWSSGRTIDMSLRKPYTVNLGGSRRRAWRFTESTLDGQDLQLWKVLLQTDAGVS